MLLLLLCFYCIQDDAQQLKYVSLILSRSEYTLKILMENDINLKH